MRGAERQFRQSEASHCIRITMESLKPVAPAYVGSGASGEAVRAGESSGAVIRSASAAPVGASGAAPGSG